MRATIVLLCVLLSSLCQGADSLLGTKVPAAKPLSERGLDELKRFARNGSRSAILELGKRTDPDVTAFLEELHQKHESKMKSVEERFSKKLTDLEIGTIKSKHSETAHASEMALAKRGNTKFKSKFIEGLKGKDIHHRAECLNALAYIGDPDTIAPISALLADDSRPEKRSGLYGQRATISEIAAHALSEIRPDVVAGFPHDAQGDVSQRLKAWRDWWTAEKKSGK